MVIDTLTQRVRKAEREVRTQQSKGVIGAAMTETSTIGQKETQLIAREGPILKAHLRGENIHGLPPVLVLDPDLLLSRIDHSAPHEASLVHGRYHQV